MRREEKKFITSLGTFTQPFIMDPSDEKHDRPMLAIPHQHF